jgi:uncharacterized protein (DUF1501 family)
MDLTNSNAFTRRAFLHRGLTLASTAITIPAFLQHSATALAQAVPVGVSPASASSGRILVVVQLAGGNDGLNTVIPFGDRVYYKARPGIAVPEKEVLRLTKDSPKGIGLHPRMTPFRELHDEGLLTIVQGVGYPNPNRSHFKSMDIWHTGETSGTGDGWLGRYFDNQCAGAPGTPPCSGHDGVAIGRSAPLAMQGRNFKPISFETPDLFRWTGEDEGDVEAKAYADLMRTPAPPDTVSPESFLTRTALDAQIASERIRAAVARRPSVEYPRNRLAQQLAMVASMIRAGLETRVYYVTLGGFDTHAGQGGPTGTHANLLDQFASSVRAFQRDLAEAGIADRVLTMSFSEFGRRVGQNGSGGTDHGTAAPMFLVGPMVRPGVLGDMPSLTDLDSGDLRFNVDFRCVYAGILEQWLEADAAKVLGERFKPALVVRKG